MNIVSVGAIEGVIDDKVIVMRDGRHEEDKKVNGIKM